MLKEGALIVAVCQFEVCKLMPALFCTQKIFAA